MVKVIMGFVVAFLLLIGIGCLVFGLLNLKIAIGYRKSNMTISKGFLQKKEHRRDVCHNKTWYKQWTDFTYTYRYNDKSYEIKSGMPGFQSTLPSTVMVHHQKKKPQYSYIPNMTKTYEIGASIFASFGGILIIFSALYLFREYFLY